MKLQENISRIKQMMGFLNEELNDNENIKLYHRVGNKKDLGVTALIKSVMNNGLIRYDNGEIGNVIWFSNTFDDYSNNGNFVVSIDYNTMTKEKYQIRYDNHNGYAYEDIPFYELEVEKIPVLFNNGRVISSDKMIRFINDGHITVKNMNGLKNLIIYEDIFNLYVQPYINIPDFIENIDVDKRIMIL
jgi:hypothetical protein